MKYTIDKGDTLSKISAQTGVSIEDIMKANSKITNKNQLIYVGDTIDIPGTQEPGVTGMIKNWWEAYVGLFKRFIK